MMQNIRLTTDLWVKAHIRRCQSQGAFAALIQHGDDTAGAILLKLNDLSGNFWVLARATDGDGRLYWFYGTGKKAVCEADATTYIEKQMKFDPDLWVLEIEDRQGRHFLDEPIES